jgi:hypothetical protein
MADFAIQRTVLRIFGDIQKSSAGQVPLRPLGAYARRTAVVFALGPAELGQTLPKAGDLAGGIEPPVCRQPGFQQALY